MKAYISQPDILGDIVVFVSDDDLWLLRLGDDTPVRLTVGFGVVGSPRISPDGQSVAFRGSVIGGQNVSEAYIVSINGGRARRLTYFGSQYTDVVGWSADGRLIVCSDYNRPFRSWRELFIVDPRGGEPVRLPYGPATSLLLTPIGTLLGRNTVDLPHWKRYRGGTKGEFWIDRGNRGVFEKFFDLEGNLNSPMWVGDRFYFVSDHEGIGNVYSVNAEGRDLRKHTNQGVYYVRNARSDGRRIVYQCGGELYLLDPLSGIESKLEVDVPSPMRQKEPKFVEVSKFVEEYRPHPQNPISVFTVRGKPFVMGNWEGAPIQVGEPDGARYRHAQFTADGLRLLVVSDQSGEERLELYTLRDGGKKVFDHDFGLVEELKASPNGALAALANNRFELWLINLESGDAKLLDRSEYGVISGLDWHPSGKWLAYSFPENHEATSIRIVGVDSMNPVRVSTPTSHDFSPSFDPEGKYLYYLSSRHLDPVYDRVVFDLGFPKPVKPFLVTLKASTPSPFNRTPSYESDSHKETDGEVDLKGIELRVEPFPVEEGNYSKIVGAKGKVLLLSHPVEGAMSTWLWSTATPTNATIEAYSLVDLAKDVFMQGVTDFEPSTTREAIIVKVGDAYRYVKVDQKPEDRGKEPGPRTGWINLARIKVLVDPEKEWSQMLRETWRLMRENYWREDLAGVDWEAIYERYARLLNRVNTRFELSDVIREMQGEMGTSHAYEIGGDYGEQKVYPVGGLGAELEFNGEGYVIKNLFLGDPSNEGEKSPLLTAGVNVNVGDTILSIDGKRLDRYTTPNQLLLNRAGEQVVLQIKTKQGETRSVTVTTLRNEKTLIYRSWVEANRRYVHEKSGGKVGYIHIPDMGPFGYAEFHRLYPLESTYDALIVDVRYNGGGHVSHLILEKLARRRIGYDKPRRGKPYPYPPYSVNGPIVAITNEQAGSDGDIFSHGFKLLGLGPLIGRRTWGGVVGINPRVRLVDGTFVTQPQFAFWFKDVGWGIENWGTEPTLWVENKPQDYAKGVDTQLEKAIEEALRLLHEVQRLPEPS
ncbi:MAG: PDZ domain-containing protein [Thermoprotei archaeon]